MFHGYYDIEHRCNDLNDIALINDPWLGAMVADDRLSDDVEQVFEEQEDPECAAQILVIRWHSWREITMRINNAMCWEIQCQRWTGALPN